MNKENRDPKYVESIVNRSQKIVDKLGLTDAKVAEDVCNVIANRYFELNDIYEIRDAKVKAVKESGLTGDAKNEALKAAENEKDALCGRNGNDAGHHVYGTRICGRNRGCGWCH